MKLRTALIAAFTFIVAINVIDQAQPAVRVIDGDTIEIRQTGERIRILGMDAPEIHPARCSYELWVGEKARDFLAAALRDAREVWFVRHGRDRYGRTLAQILVDNHDIAPLMIRAGLARPYSGERRQSWCGGQ